MKYWVNIVIDFVMYASLVVCVVTSWPYIILMLIPIIVILLFFRSDFLYYKKTKKQDSLVGIVLGFISLRFYNDDRRYKKEMSDEKN